MNPNTPKKKMTFGQCAANIPFHFLSKWCRCLRYPLYLVTPLLHIHSHIDYMAYKRPKMLSPSRPYICVCFLCIWNLATKKKNLYLLNYCRPFPNCTFTSSNKVPSTTIWAVCFITLTFLIIILISTSLVCPPPITVGSCVTMFLTAVTSERGRDILSYPIGQICNINRTRKYIASKLN